MAAVAAQKVDMGLSAEVKAIAEGGEEQVVIMVAMVASLAEVEARLVAVRPYEIADTARYAHGELAHPAPRPRCTIFRLEVLH